jgi:hypothetical protein
MKYTLLTADNVVLCNYMTKAAAKQAAKNIRKSHGIIAFVAKR